MSKITDTTHNGRYYRQWQCADAPQAIVLLVHGLGEHCQRYDALGAALNNAGYYLSAIDLPGHGRSQGRRGHIDHFSEYNTAVLELYQRLRNDHPHTPIHLFGHSMGGLISSSLLLEHQDKFASALLSGAAIQSAQQPPNWQIAIITAISKIAPKLGMLSLDANGISRDPEVVAKYMADPLVNKGKLSAKFLVEMFAVMQTVQTQANTITLPLLIMHGTGDEMTSPQGSQLLFDTASSSDKALKLYADLKHEILNESEADTVIADMLNWLAAHTPH